MYNVFANFATHDPSVTNPQTFTVDLEDGQFVFYRGHHRVFLTPYVVKALINADDMYTDVDWLLKISRDPADFGNDLTNLLKENAAFAEVVKTEFDNGVTTIYFALDIDRLGIKAPSAARRFIYGDHDFYISIPPVNINMQTVFNHLQDAFAKAAASTHFTPALETA